MKKFFTEAFYLLVAVAFWVAFGWMALDAMEKETEARILRQQEKAAMWGIADIKDQNPKHEIRDCVILKGPTRCEAFKGGRGGTRTIKEAK